MNKPVYTPVIRYRQEEKKVLTSFDFGDKIYPYIEIFKKLERVHTSKKKSEPTFHEVHLPILRDIKSNKVFVDLPVHLKTSTKMKKEVVEFLTQVIGNRLERTSHLIGLKSLNNKIIPIISTYSQRTGEPNSIIAQENDLRSVFNSLGFRTSSSTFDNDMKQIIKVAKADDYLFVDLEEYCLASGDDRYAIDFMLDFVKSFKSCPVIILNSPIHHTTTNSGLEHGMRIEKADNSLQYSYKSYGAKGFGDYAGLKKDVLEGGGRISPGFIFYDAVENSYYGYKGLKRKQGELEDFLDIIIPKVLKSDAVNRMLISAERYLDNVNPGWKLINEMLTGIENPKSQSKFKRISMLHYLYCINKKIQAAII
ncbi:MULTISPECIES: beta family protein [Sphingobacterium]|uniref:beta family protein n=1 Tax=Sphingobacterium TaxID=28453 RepID=UPI001048508B|nr:MULTISPECIES: hypothetical protein [Sphingobacterium]MCW2259492.1 hypothetical protein [Sphingobacterium kitahiroshimense]TCR14061.1 T4 beta protein [Sphingobacterium sp. JUb78]